jgi:hypothetical protein
MTENFSPSKHEALEADLHYLAQEVKRYQEQPENRNVSEAELIKRALQSKAATQTDEDTRTAPKDQSPLPDYLKSESPETKLEVEYLLDLAFHKGVDKAIARAKGTTPFILDAFHDSLIQAVYPELKKRGLL